MERITVGGVGFVRLFSEEDIAARVVDMAASLLQAFDGVEEPIEICVIMNGAFILAADLVRKLDGRFRLHFVRLKSYEGMQRGELVMEGTGLKPGQFAGRHVVLLDDIIDSGRTLFRFREEVLQQGPASLRIACLVLKPASLEVPLDIWHAGFRIGPAFIVGYGMDFDQLGRGYGVIWQAEQGGEPSA